ncbi:MAG: metallophosphoesterase [Planctomycetaceae bacterium]|nr:metallophosphoesterase [Planctomycetaceae bacterium]
MRVGIVSDTHGHVRNTLQAVAQLNVLKVDVVIHCGDIGSPTIIPLFAGWPAHFVLGNVDHDEAALQWIIRDEGQTFHGGFARITLENKLIAVAHGHDADVLHAAIHSGEYDLVCTGHTHQRELRQVGRTIVLNPGALYRSSRKSFAVVDWPSGEVEFVDLLESSL